MPAEFSKAPPVKEIALRLIPKYFSELLEHRVHIEYVFSDQELEKNGKTTWGMWMKKGALERLLMGDELDDPFDPLTFVCTGCNRWRTDEELQYLTVGDKQMKFCRPCERQYFDMDFTINKNIQRLEVRYDRAQIKEKEGPPDHPGFFVIKMFSPVWNRITDEQREYLVYHELCHAGVGWDNNGNTKLYIVPHDIEEFASCARRYGRSIRSDLKRFVEAIDAHGQQTLSFDTADQEDEEDEETLSEALDEAA